MMAEPFLHVEAADVYYGASQILFGVDLAVEQGQTMALLGRNGAGKSTTFKMIAGLASILQDRTIWHRLCAGKPPSVSRAHRR
jgi:branched-chain amino acid transport system ATP-binding protein